MINPKISVIMPVYNAEKYVKESIDSILAQSFTDFELIIIDDCGQDHSMQYVKGYDDPRIIILENDANRGIAYSRNAGIKAASGELIALMDDDDIAPKNRFELEVEYLDKYPDVDVVGGGELWIDESGNIISYYDQVICNPKRIKAELLFQDVIENGSAMFRREFIIKNNIRYKDGYLGMEDYKFWTDCAAVGKIANISDILLYWRKTNNSETSRVFADESEKRTVKFAEIQSDLLDKYGFSLTKLEKQVFTSCFREDKRGELNRSEINELFLLVRKMIEQAHGINKDYSREFVQVLKRRFIQKLEYATFWDDGKDLLEINNEYRFG